MNQNEGIFRWRRILHLWHVGFLVLALKAASGDALDNWTSHRFVPDGSPFLWKIVYHRGWFVAAGTGPYPQDTPTVILHSADGLKWVRGNVQGWNGFAGVAASPDYIVGVGFLGETQLGAGDGTNWAGNYYQAGANLNAVAYGAGRFVAVGGHFSGSSAGVIATSTDGFNWVSGSFVLFPPPDGFVTVAFGNGMFWAATPTRLYSSTNGTSFRPFFGAGGAHILCFGNSRFVGVSTNLMVNTNGTVWTSTSWPTASPFNRVAFGAGMFVATAGRDVASSVDGFNWIVRTNALPLPVFDLTFGNGVFMAVTASNFYYSGSIYFMSQPVARVSPSAEPGRLWVHGVRDRQYDILATNNLTASNWPALSRVTLTNSPQSWTDPNPGGVTNGAWFYRSSLVP